MPKKSTVKPLILLSNDDGFLSEGIRTLSRHLKHLGQVFIVAPDSEKSTTSLSLTLRQPLRVQKIRANIYAVDGTPADCIYIALKKLLPRSPDLIISGLNHGANLCQQDISYSGTVAAAIQGTFFEVPSIAISLLADKNGRYFFDLSAKIAFQIAERLLKAKLPEGVILNINIPPPPIKGIKIAKLGQKRYEPEIIEKKDPRQNTYYWIGTGNPKTYSDEESDARAVSLGYISVTPLHTDLTDFRAMALPALNKLLDFSLTE